MWFGWRMDVYSHYLSKLERQLLQTSFISTSVCNFRDFSLSRKLLCLPVYLFFLPFFFCALPLLLTKQYSRTNFICCSLANMNRWNLCWSCAARLSSEASDTAHKTRCSVPCCCCCNRDASLCCLLTWILQLWQFWAAEMHVFHLILMAKKWWLKYRTYF